MLNTNLFSLLLFSVNARVDSVGVPILYILSSLKIFELVDVDKLVLKYVFLLMNNLCETPITPKLERAS